MLTNFALLRNLVIFPVLAAAVVACGSESTAETADEQDLLEAKNLFPEPKGDPLRYPVILAHGFNGSPNNRWAFNGIQEALEADGHHVVIGSVPPFDSPAVRAEFLADQVDQALAKYGTDKVNLIAHSAGGLDVRHLVSVLHYGDRVASVTTISTPHRGSAVADVALKLLPGDFEKAIDALASAWGGTFSDLAEDSHLLDAFEALAERNADKFEAEHPDDPGVYYQSWAGVSNVAGIPNPKDDDACDGKLKRHKLRADVMDATLVPSAAFVAHGVKLRPNDGIATVESSKHGDFRGCVPADHLDEVGQVGDHGMNKHTGFDVARFYRTIAFELSDMGF